MIIDTETSGLDVRRDSLREFSASVMDKRCERVQAKYEWRASEGSPQLCKVVKALRSRLSVGVLVAHNLEFDLAFLRRHEVTKDTLLSKPDRWFCTMRASGGLVSLDLLAACCNLVLVDRHTASGDTQGLADVMTSLCAAARCRASASISDIREIAVMRCQSGPGGESIELTEPWAHILRSLPRAAPVPFPTPEQRSLVAAIRGRFKPSGGKSPNRPTLKQALKALEAAQVSRISLEKILADSGIHQRDT